MSDYRDKAINPKTGEAAEADFLDNYFGRHCYGIRFVGEEHVYPWHEVPRLFRQRSAEPHGGSA